MTCVDCQSLLTSHLNKTKGIITTRVSLLTGMADVTFDPKLLQPEKIITTIGQVNFKASIVGDSSVAQIKIPIQTTKQPKISQEEKKILSKYLMKQPGVYSVDYEPLKVRSGRKKINLISSIFF